ncbi:MAG TPA: helical backbone metal receptor [Polyangiaceae bacterium]|nr:helical backbone metal receptor [Polyangiaceae bacterium]
MNRRSVLRAAFLVAAWPLCGCRGSTARKPNAARRVVSLSPAITETMFAIGAGSELVGVSDYCNYPQAAKQLPRTGTALTPNYEAIVRLGPTLILCEAAESAPRRELTALGVTKFIPWLSLEDIVAGTRLLGALSGEAENAGALATKLWDGLAVAENPSGPRVLAVLGEGDAKLSEIYFIKRNSIHGAALRAAGARNAVATDIPGVPRLSVEELIRLDPEAIIVLVAPNAAGDADILREYRALAPLTANKNNRITVLKSDEAFANGPRILTLAEHLKQKLAELFPASAKNP